MIPKIFQTPEELLKAIGTKLGPTEWLTVTQQRIDLFADATDDHQWIHVDPVRAKQGPFGATIAHGYLTLALANYFLPRLIEVRGIRMGVNYGCERVRFPEALKVDSRVRATGEIVSVEEIKGAVQSTVRVQIDIEDKDRPACVVDTISRYYPDDKPR